MVTPRFQSNMWRRIFRPLIPALHHKDIRRLLVIFCAALASKQYNTLRTTYFTPFFTPSISMTTDVLYSSPSNTASSPQVSSTSNKNNNNKVYCIGFRRTSCNRDHRLPWLDLSCDDPIPLIAAGYCEYQIYNNHSGLQFFHKSCESFRTAKSVTCRMAVDFHNYKRQALDFVPPDPSSNAILDTTIRPEQRQDRGIVMSLYPDVLLSVYAILHLLRYTHHCTLPIELWSLPGEFDPAGEHQSDGSHILFQHILQLPNVTHRTTPKAKDTMAQSATHAVSSIAGFMIKPYSIFYSHFEQVLWLDSDNVPIRDPWYLFDTLPYQTTGTLFFQDYWQPVQSIFSLNENSLVWELLGIPFRPTEFEMESGQLLVDKRRPTVERALTVVLYLAMTFESRWIGPLALLWGDKDLFRMGFHVVHEQQKKDNPKFHDTTNAFSYVVAPPSPLGYTVDPTNGKTYKKLRAKSNGSSTCGVTMLQYDTDGRPLFLHRNSFKLNHKQPATLKTVWEGVYEFTGNDPSTQYRIGSTKDKGRRVTCYHAERDNAEYFQERNVTDIYPEIVRVEQQLIQFAKQGVVLMASSKKRSTTIP